MATLRMKVFCILPLFFASAIEAHWRGIPYVPNPLFAHHQGSFGFDFEHDHGHQKHGVGFHLFDDNPQPDAPSKAANDPNPEADPKPADEADLPEPGVVPAQPAVVDGNAVPDGDPNPEADPKPADKADLPEPGVVPAQPAVVEGNAVPDAPAQPDFPIGGKGAWEMILKDSGVSVMHINVLPNNKILFIDNMAFHISTVKLPNNDCAPWEDDKHNKFCDPWSHAMEYDIEKNTVRPLKTIWDPWCSSGGIMPDGRFISTGGFFRGYRTVRYFTPCNDGKCDFKDVQNALADNRWYSTQITLADGRLLLVGGRHSYSFEYVLPEGQENKQAIKSVFLDETTEMDEHNLYPFVVQSSDGNIFIFANDRSILLSPETNRPVKEFPKLPGGARNYPASGMSALLPIELKEQNPEVVPLDILVCGGAPKDAFKRSANQPPEFVPALDDCNRLRITDPNPVWDNEKMPSPRVMGDMLNLPTGDLLIINGAKAGTSAWFQADDPNFTPHIYNPRLPKGQRFFDMAPTTVPRMYHSTSAVLTSGKILVAGSNPVDGYAFEPTPKSKYVTEMRLEIFTPPYMDKALDIHRPVINAQATDNKLKYGANFGVQFNLNDADKPTKNDIKLHMYAVPFTTHGYSQNQRLLVLAITDFKAEGPGVYRLTALAPPSGSLAPPGYYMLFVVHRGVPGAAVWVSINN